MKKHMLLISNLIIVFSILIGFIGVVYKDTRTYQKLTEKHLENIISLAEINISKQIESSMTRPIMASIRTYENDYDLSVYIINVGGSKNSFEGGTDIFVSEDELEKRTGIKEKIATGLSGEPKMDWFTVGDLRKCRIIRYDSTLGWYLVLEKGTKSISSSFQKEIMSNVTFILVLLIACITVTTAVFIIYNRRMVVIENTDELTGLPNRKLFFKRYLSFIRYHREQKMTLFMLDIDFFKDINDTFGHLFGNVLLGMVGDNLREAIGGHGIVARWGGDEFIGILKGDSQEAERIISQFMSALKGEEKDSRYHITISVGIAEIDRKLSTEQMFTKVDEALYLSKKNGRNRSTICKTDDENLH